MFTECFFFVVGVVAKADNSLSRMYLSCFRLGEESARVDCLLSGILLITVIKKGVSISFSRLGVDKQ